MTLERDHGASSGANSGPGSRGRTALRRLGLGALTLSLAFMAGFLLFVLRIEKEERDPEGRSDGIVALTGGAERIEEALALLSKGFGSRLLITGVNVRTSRDGIRRVNAGPPDLVACCVDLDYRARDTVGNAAAIRRWARDHGFRSLIVVTSNYHLPRALAELDHALPDVRKVPYAVVPSVLAGDGWPQRLVRTRLLATEYLKFLAVWLRTKLPLPAPGEPTVEESAALMAKTRITR